MAEKALNVFTVVGRMFGWGMLGAVCGVCLALVTGLLHLPSYEASNPLANEWYPVGVILTMFFACCAGFLLGAAIAAAVWRPWARKKVFLLAIVGAVLGVGAVRFVPESATTGIAGGMRKAPKKGPDSPHRACLGG